MSFLPRVSIYKLFPNDTEDISSKFEVLKLYMALLKGVPDMDDPSNLQVLLSAKDTVDLEDDTRREDSDYVKAIHKYLRKDISVVPILEKMRTFFLRGVQVPKGDKNTDDYEAYNKEMYVRRLNVLTEKTAQFLDYIESHKQYQERCYKIIATMDNSMKQEIASMEQNNNEILRALFSMLDDLIELDPSYLPIFKDIIKGDDKKDDVLKDSEIQALQAILEEINKANSVEQYSLFHLENIGLIKNFSFAKQSKFFDMYDCLT